MDFYTKDLVLIRMINIFTLMAILVGGMGVFAFSALMAAGKKKEVALRKVNGATEWQIVKWLNRSFILKTLIACGVGLPVAYTGMEHWLRNFAYKTDLSWYFFLGVVLICLFFVVSVITWQCYKAATVNPVKSLMKE